MIFTRINYICNTFYCLAVWLPDENIAVFFLNLCGWISKTPLNEVTNLQKWMLVFLFKSKRKSSECIHKEIKIWCFMYGRLNLCTVCKIMGWWKKEKHHNLTLEFTQHTYTKTHIHRTTHTDLSKLNTQKYL